MTLDQEIGQMEQALEAKRAELDNQQHPKEVLREIVGEKLLNKDGQPTPEVERPGADVETSAGTEAQREGNFGTGTAVQQLVNKAFSSSIEAAVEEAKATNNAALIDAFHDALVDELYDVLVERGKIKKI